MNKHQQDWGAFSCRVEDKPAVFLVDLGYRSEAPISNYIENVILALKYTPADQNGFPSSEDLQTIGGIEEEIVNKLESALYVGAYTTDGFKYLVFYTSDKENLFSVIKKVMDKTPTTFDVYNNEDKNWEMYFDFLYPDSYQLQNIYNEKILAALDERGDDLEKSRKIDHYAYFPSEENAKLAAEALKKMGFTIEQLSKSDNNAFGVSIYKEDSPLNMRDVVFDIMDAIEPFSGVYDGWGTICVNK